MTFFDTDLFTFNLFIACFSLGVNNFRIFHYLFKRSSNLGLIFLTSLLYCTQVIYYVVSLHVLGHALITCNVSSCWMVSVLLGLQSSDGVYSGQNSLVFSLNNFYQDWIEMWNQLNCVNFLLFSPKFTSNWAIVLFWTTNISSLVNNFIPVYETMESADVGQNIYLTV